MNTLVFMAAAILLIAAMQALARTLPTQNVAFIVGILVASEWVLQYIWADQRAYGSALLFWPATIIWARIVIRWSLRRRCQEWNYGIRLILLAGAATALGQFAVALFWAGGSAPMKRSGIRFAEAAVCLFFLSPWFISKLPQQPHERAQ